MIENNTIKINEGKRRTGKDEMNLIELPFTLLTKRNLNKLKTIERTWMGKGEDGQKRKFYKIITSSDKWGLPTFMGEELYLACMELSYNQGFKTRKVNTTQYELINLMGWPTNDGRSYMRLIKTFNQLGGVWITTNAFWDNQGKEYKKRGFGIIDDYCFSEKERRGRRGNYQQLSLPFGYFNWNETFFNESLKKGNIKTLNTTLYFSLSNNTSKRLYRFADKKLYNQQTFELDLFRLAFEKLEMIGNYKYPSKVMEKLQPAIKELKERGIVNIQIKKSKTESGYKVCFSPATKPQVFIEKKPATEPTPKSEEKPPPTKATALVNYFHAQLDPQTNHHPTLKELQQTQDLITQHGEEKTRHIINYALQQAQKTNFKMCRFGAILDYTQEALDHLTQEQERKERQQAIARQQKEEYRLKTEYDNYRQKQFKDLKTSLPPDELKALYTQAEKHYFQQYPQMRKWAKGGKEDNIIFQTTIESNFNDWLIAQHKIKILNFEAWQEMAKQPARKTKTKPA